MHFAPSARSPARKPRFFPGPYRPSCAEYGASLPNAISFGLVGAVTAEILTGASGIGKLLLTAIDTANSDLTFAVVIYVSVAGIVLVLASSRVRHRVLHWWDQAPV